MALIPVSFTTDADYTGSYTLKIFNVGNLVTPIFTKTYSPPHAATITDLLTITGYKSYVIRIYADECGKIVAEETVTAPSFCDQPRGLIIGPIAATTATIRYAAPLTGTPVNDYYYEIYNGVTLVQSANTSLITLNITGLTTATLYTVYVYSRCSPTLLSSYVTTTFTTL